MPTRVVNPTNQGVNYSFDKDSTDATLKVIGVGESIINVTVEVTEVFEIAKILTIGIPSDHDKFVELTDIDLTTLGVYEKTLYYTATAGETVSAFFSGVSATGAGKIFIEMLQS